MGRMSGCKTPPTIFGEEEEEVICYLAEPLVEVGGDEGVVY